MSEETRPPDSVPSGRPDLPSLRPDPEAAAPADQASPDDLQPDHEAPGPGMDGTPGVVEPSVDALEPQGSGTPVATSGYETPSARQDADAPARSAGKLPVWLLILGAAIVPAVIVGIVVALLAGGGGSSGGNHAAGVVDGFLHSSPSKDQQVVSYKEQVPPGFPKDFPVYNGAKSIASFTVQSSDGISYFAVFATPDSEAKIYDFYRDRMDKDPYQLEIATAGDDFTGVRFNSPTNPDIAGEVAIHKSLLDNQTDFFVSFQDSSQSAQDAKPTAKYVVPPSRALPDGYPTGQVPIYKGKSDSIVTYTYLERDKGETDYELTFLTKDSVDDVMSFYKDQFKKQNWTVDDSSDKNQGFTVAIDFNDSTKATTGTVSADRFTKDSSYTEVDISVDLTQGGSGSSTLPGIPGGPSGGGGSGASSTPSAATTPSGGSGGSGTAATPSGGSGASGTGATPAATTPP